MLTENYCDYCDAVVHQVFDENDFADHKVGAMICPNCGKHIMPCNECVDPNHNCEFCPWKNCKPVTVMTEFEYIEWMKENEGWVYELMKNGDLGEGYKELVKEFEG